MTAELPTGTVTLMFTDIEGSTKLLHELGPEAYAEALAEHRRLLRDAYGRHGGVEVDTQGDAFFYSFPDAREAVVAADQGREALRPGPIHLRVGIQTGRPAPRAGGIRRPGRAPGSPDRRGRARRPGADLRRHTHRRGAHGG